MSDKLNALVFIASNLGSLFFSDPKLNPEVQGIYSFFEGAKDRARRTELCAEWPFVLDSKKDQLNEAFKLMSEAQIGQGLIEEYRRLFVGPGHLPVPPYGSVYTDHEQVVFGLTCLELRAYMRSLGISLNLEARIPEDHIGLMFYLLGEIEQSVPEELERYLSEHFLSWAPHYLELLYAEAHHPFYKGLALLSLLTLEGIAAEFTLRPRKLRFYR